jgi:hypothetical protein
MRLLPFRYEKGRTNGQKLYDQWKAERKDACNLFYFFARHVSSSPFGGSG